MIDLHKFYFENILKAASFSFTIIGAILTFTINSKLSSTQIQMALQFPFLLSIGTCVIFVIGIVKTKQFEEWVKKFQENLFENKSELDSGKFSMRVSGEKKIGHPIPKSAVMSETG